MSKREHHSEGEDEPNTLKAQASKIDKQSKSKTRTMSLSKPKTKKAEEPVKAPQARTRTFSFRGPQRDQLKKEEKIKNCKKLLKNNGSYEFLCCYSLDSKKTFILTPTHFFLAKKNFEPEDKDSYVFPWNYLKSFKISSNQVNLEFKSLNEPPVQGEKLDFKLKFHKNEYDEGVGKLCNTLQNILIPRELRVLKFYDLEAPKAPISALSALNRFRMLNSIAKLNSKTAKQMEDIIIYSQPEIDVSSFPEEPDKVLPVLYKLLPFLYIVQTIKIPPNHLPVKDSFTPIKDSTSLLALKLSGEIGECLQEFLKIVNQSDDRGTQLSGLIFNQSNFSAQDLETVSDFITKSNIRSIGFNNAIKQEAIPQFSSTFLTSKITDHLLSLNLDNTSGLDVVKILPKLRKVALLSLQNCDLNLFHVFNQLVKFNKELSQLQMINLSNNNFQEEENADEFPSDESKLPSRLTGFVMNDITWGDHLKDFLEFIFSHVESKLKLSLSDSQSEDEKWEEAFEYLSTSEFTGLSELVWDNNPIRESLFTFLKNNSNLIRLQINGCLTSSNENEITAFCDFVKNATALEGLVVRGTSSEGLGKFTSNVIEAAREAKELVLLDIGGSRAGEVIEETTTEEEAKTYVSDSLQQISQLCNDSEKLTYLNYDGMLPQTDDSYVLTIKELNKKSERIKISFPINDLENLVKEKQLSERKLSKLKTELAFTQGFNFPTSQFQKSQKAKSKTAEIYPWPDSFFSQPSSLYRLFDPPPFPYYVSIKVQNQLKKASQPFSFAVDEKDALRYDPSAQQPSLSLSLSHTQDDFGNHSDPEVVPKTRTKKRPQFGSVRIPHKSMMTYKKGTLLKSSAVLLEAETNKKNEELRKRIQKSKETQKVNQAEKDSEKSEQEKREKEEQEKREKEEKEKREKEEQEKREKEEQEKREKEEQEKREKEEQEKREKEEQEKRRIEEEEENDYDNYREDDESENENERPQIQERNINITKSDSNSFEVQISPQNSNDEDEQNQKSQKRSNQNQSSPGFSKPPIPLRKYSTSSSELLEVPDFSINPKDFFDISYPINWEEIDRKITLNGLYNKLASEKRSDLMNRLTSSKI